MGHFLIAYLIHQIGAYRTMAICLSLSAIGTAIMPFAHDWGNDGLRRMHSLGFYAIAAIRFVHGVSFSIAFSFIGTNAARWAPLKEQLSQHTFLASALPVTFQSNPKISGFRWGR